jgi:Asp/Glu/hydantoin racemase
MDTMVEGSGSGKAKRTLRVLLINPNTSAATTELMLRIARKSCGSDIEIEGATAPFGEALITDDGALSTAADAVLAIVDRLAAPGPDGIVIAAFGDPALEAVRERVDLPVVGIAEASMFEAAAGGRKFSVATTTPDLVDAIRRCALRYGLGDQLLSVRTTSGDARAVMADGGSLRLALEKVAKEVIQQDGAEAVVIGGGPLAEAARHLAQAIRVPIIEPIPAAIRLLRERCGMRR